MKRIIGFVKNTFLNKNLDLRVRLFNILGMAGIAIALISTVDSVLTNLGPLSHFLNLMTAPLALALMYYASRSGRYQLCYMITIVAIFLLAFTFIFLVSGGYLGGMPFYFIFAVVFTIFMLEGKKALIMAGVELVVYSCLCFYDYFVRGTNSQVWSDQKTFTALMFGFILVSTSLGITMFLHFRLYNEQQRQLERARKEAIRLSEAKTAFLANMSHEIRTPINVILGMNEMVLRESESRQITSYGLNIQSAGKTLLSLINNILDVSKIESGKLTVIEERYRTAELIHELAVMGAERAAKQGIRFIVDADKSLPAELTGDYIHVKQVVVNLLSNAVKYTSEGAVLLELRHKKTEAPGQILLCINVSDTGIGIREEDIDSLFDAFTRVDLPAHRDIEGTGLGLAIVKELTELMGGSVTVKSVWGEGSAFSVVIPQTVASAAPMGDDTAVDGKEPSGGEGTFIAPNARILLVDDNAENLMVVKSLLGRTMLRVDTAENGPQCVQAAKQTHYHAILLDYMMPDMDGVETLHRLEELPGFSSPVIALTANAVAGAKEMFLREGFAAYLSKPVMWQELESVLLSCLPPALVSKSGLREKKSPVSPEKQAALARELERSDVEMEAGLRYLSGDVLQYKKLAELFVENGETGMAQMRSLLEREDWQALTYPVHSLKSKAKAVGALELFDVAARLEGRCVQRDGAYIRRAMPLLLLGWERACAGLRIFIAHMGQLVPQVEDEAATADNAALLAAVRAFRRADAENELARRMKREKDTEMRKKLEAIRLEVQTLNFEEAERLLLAHMEEMVG